MFVFMAEKKRYTVREGKKPGIYNNRWACKSVVDGFPGAKYKSFLSLDEAEEAFRKNYSDYYQVKTKEPRDLKSLPIQHYSIAVDAACSGNPGVLEYQWVDIASGDVLFKQKFPMWTNNIWEFLAIVHGLAYLDKIGSDKALYSDSKHAISRVEQKKCKTKLPETADIQDIFRQIQRAEDWLHTHRYKNQILKRHTKDRWEIPADFGRK